MVLEEIRLARCGSENCGLVVESLGIRRTDGVDVQTCARDDLALGTFAFLVYCFDSLILRL